MQPVEKISKLGWAWLAGLFVAFATYWLLSYCDTATILQPRNNDVLEVVFWAAGGVGLVSAFVGYTTTSGALVSRLVLATLVYGLFGALSALLLLGTTSNIVQNLIYFPAAQTHSFSALIPISRAYVGHSRTCAAENSCWNVQTMPIWSDLNVFEGDYRFMLENRRPNDAGQDDAEISSLGYHCLRVKLQKAGQAMRIIDSGSQTLPKGSVVLCPDGGLREIMLDPYEH